MRTRGRGAGSCGRGDDARVDCPALDPGHRWRISRSRTISVRGSQGQPNRKAPRSCVELLRCAVLKRAWPFALVAIGIASTACTRVTDERRFEANPQQLEIVRTMPEPGAQVPPDAVIRLCWSALLDPNSLTDVDAVLSSGNAVTDARLDLELRPWTDASGSSVTPTTDEPWCPGSVVRVTPKAALESGVRYRLRFEDSPVGWRGETIDIETEGWSVDDEGAAFFFVEFDVVDDAEAAPPPSEAPTLAMLFEDNRIFDPQRPTCSCHRDPDDDASLRLDLRDPTSANSALLFDSRARDTGFPMVTPRRPSESFLIHKLLREDGAPLHGIRGNAMPLGADRIAYTDFVDLARWIEAGAN